MLSTEGFMAIFESISALNVGSFLVEPKEMQGAKGRFVPEGVVLGFIIVGRKTFQRKDNIGV